jgi:hypothetical protein
MKLDHKTIIFGFSSSKRPSDRWRAISATDK